MNFSKNLKLLREKKGFSQQNMAEKLDISVQAYSRYENTDQEPRAKRLIELAKIFNVSIDLLLTPDEYLIENDNWFYIKKYVETLDYTFKFKEDGIEFGRDGLINKHDYGFIHELDQEIRETILKLFMRTYKPSKDINDKD